MLILYLIVEIECDFLTGLQKSIGIVCNSFQTTYWYDTETQVRFKNHVEHKDLPTYIHCRPLTWKNYIIYSGRAVYVEHPTIILGVTYQAYWHYIGTGSSLNQAPNLFPE